MHIISNYLTEPSSLPMGCLLTYFTHNAISLLPIMQSRVREHLPVGICSTVVDFTNILLFSVLFITYLLCSLKCDHMYSANYFNVQEHKYNIYQQYERYICYGTILIYVHSAALKQTQGICWMPNGEKYFPLQLMRSNHPM